ncbi:MAG TPA: DUF2442 domain-containing protein [Tichowtungia sp.]|nr:DUF2442 domain-containing protein [Tichowtungia sp.]
MNKIHKIESVQFEDGKLLVTADGQTVARNLTEVSPRLAAASDAARNQYDISPSGYGIHWPDCDEDLSVDALLGIPHKAPAIAAEEGIEYKIK